MARGTIITRITKDGTKRYKTVIRLNGRQQWRTWDRKRDAEDYLDRNSTDVRDGTYREIKKATFGEYVSTWKQIHLNNKAMKPSTLNGYASIIEYRLLPEFKSYQMQAIDHDQISIFRSKLLKGTEGRALTPKSIRNILQLLGKILDDAKKAHYLRVNPMVDVDKPKITKDKKGRALTPEEFNAILAECSERLRPIYLMSALAGTRRGEAFGLPWEHVDIEDSVIRIRQSLFWQYGKYQDVPEGAPNYTFVSPKSAESVRDIDMSPALRKELLALYMKGGKKGLVFCNSDGTPLNPDNMVKRDFARAIRAADAKRAENNLPAIGHVRWHDLRHTFGSWKIEQGENVYYVMRQMGHSSIQVTIDIYGHLLKARNPEAAAKTDLMVFGG